MVLPSTAMRGKRGAGMVATAGTMLAIGIALLVASANAGSIYQGCGNRSIFMDGQPGDIDHFVAGFNPDSDKALVKGTRTNSAGTTESSVTCNSPFTFFADLRDRADRVRADGRDLNVSGYGALPRTMSTSLRGDGGNDVMIGHSGRDYIGGGPGRDIVKALGGGDHVNTADGAGLDTLDCGPGTDTAKVDPGDDRTGCEDVTVVSRPSP